MGITVHRLSEVPVTIEPYLIVSVNTVDIVRHTSCLYSAASRTVSAAYSMVFNNHVRSLNDAIMENDVTDRPEDCNQEIIEMTSEAKKRNMRGQEIDDDEYITLKLKVGEHSSPVVRRIKTWKAGVMWDSEVYTTDASLDEVLRDCVVEIERMSEETLAFYGYYDHI